MPRKRTQPNRLYLWRDVLCDYTCGVMFAIAATVDAARAAILQEAAYVSPEDLAREPEVYDMTQQMALVKYGGG